MVALTVHVAVSDLLEDTVVRALSKIVEAAASEEVDAQDTKGDT